MTEDEARNWLRDRFGAATFDRLSRFVDLLLAESERQSLIARSTFSLIWSRHIADSAQLVELAPPKGGWLDIGSGGGLPGVVIALLRDAPLTMVEPRRKRAEFLSGVIDTLKIINAAVVLSKVQAVVGPATIVSARAVAPIPDIFTWTTAGVSRETIYLLPRGENAVSDMDIARRAWHGAFHVEQSLTDPNAGIVVATGVRRR